MSKPNLTNLSQEELSKLHKSVEAELEARKTQAMLAEHQRCLALCQKLTPEFVNSLAPEHCRTSCSDSNLSNGFYSRGNGTPRCQRCALLEALSGESPPPELTFEFRFLKILDY